MSDKAIETFIKMHLEKTTSLAINSPSYSAISGDVIIAALGAVQHTHPQGCDLISAKWLNDANAIKRIEQRVAAWTKSAKTKRPDLLYHAGLIGIAVFCGRPTEDQVRSLAALWKKYSEQGHRSSRLIKKYQTQITAINRKPAVSESAQRRLDSESYRLGVLIDNERIRLNEWATSKAKSTTQCPKCSGSRVERDGSECKACLGQGSFYPTAENVRRHFRKTGVIRIGEQVWNADIGPKFDELLSRFQCEHDETAQALSQRLFKEREE